MSEPMTITCQCGTKVECDGFTNTCPKCGADYNFAGQLLAPREQWGEETGEPWYAGDQGYANPDAAFDGEDF